MDGFAWGFASGAACYGAKGYVFSWEMAGSCEVIAGKELAWKMLGFCCGCGCDWEFPVSFTSSASLLTTCSLLDPKAVANPPPKLGRALGYCSWAGYGPGAVELLWAISLPKLNLGLVPLVPFCTGFYCGFSSTFLPAPKGDDTLAWFWFGPVWVAGCYWLFKKGLFVLCVAEGALANIFA